MELFAKPLSQIVTVSGTRTEVKNDAATKFAQNTMKQHHNSSTSIAITFAELGLCPWICRSVEAVGFRRPTDIQSTCIPAILSGRSVIGCAETGSGKTAAFALPILQQLSVDPYGIFSVILTPTRELAIQISEQVAAFGSAVGVRMALVIGGESLTEQGLALSRHPHIIIATPGRLRHHLEGATPPELSRARYLVLDEADRLLAQGFSSELRCVLEAMSHPMRQTLLFSATMTSSLIELEQIASDDTLRFDLTTQQKVPSKLTQQYIFLPTRVKLCYLVAVLRSFFSSNTSASSSSEDDMEDASAARSSAAMEWYKELMGKHDSKNGHGRLKPLRKRGSDGRGGRSASTGKRSKRSAGGPSVDPGTLSSVIVFVSACRRCAEITAALQRLDIDCVSLHSMMTQSQRSEALSRFKSRQSPVLIATDVAGRGLDIPSVDLVINADLPKVASDYVHRVGRTARAGREGRALSLVTPHDVELVQAVEKYTGVKLVESSELDAVRDVVPLLNEVAKAQREARLQLLEEGFDDRAQVFADRKKKQRRNLQRKMASDKAFVPP